MSKYLLIVLLAFCSCQQQIDESSSKSTLRISSSEAPQTLDPRKARTLPNITFIKMFYEGLMNRNPDGQIVPGVAKEVHVSDDNKTYTFFLRECNWSNGDKVTAYDFERTWKSLLDPNFPAPMANHFFAIKGAERAKLSQASLDDVGIYARDDHTLVVELVEPTPYFLEMTSTPAFCPVHAEWANDPSKSLIGNGAFMLKGWKKGSEMQSVKNPHYWDQENTSLEQLSVFVLDSNTALKMFEMGDLDWAGSPLSNIPADAFSSLNDKVSSSPAAGTHWICFNTEAFPFNSVKLRNAFSFALNRQEIVDHITQGKQLPALGIVPASFELQTIPYFEDNAAEKAKELFYEALGELGIEELSEVTLTYVNTANYNHTLAQSMQQSWKQVLGVDVTLETCEYKIYRERVNNHEFQMNLSSFYADYRDPVNFLDPFKYQHSSQWQNQHFIDLLNLSARASTPKNRLNILRRAEKVLVSEMPVAPLYYNCYNYVKNDAVKEVYFSDLGYLDFKYATLDSRS